MSANLADNGQKIKLNLTTAITKKAQSVQRKKRQVTKALWPLFLPLCVLCGKILQRLVIQKQNKNMENQDKFIISELTKLLLGGSAHISLQDALKGLKPAFRGAKVEHMPYTIWQLVEHIRIAQWDMLMFSKDVAHKSPKWPEDYWPKEAGPAQENDWNGSLSQINSDLDEFIELMEHADIYQKIQHGDGQTILCEALQLADHNAYHIGEIVAIRRMLGDWR